LKIQQKLFIAIVSITIPVLVISGVISYFIAEQEVTKDILNELDTVATIEKFRVSEAVDRNFERLDLISSRTELKINLENYLTDQNNQDQEKINKILSEAKLSIHDINEIHIINSEGKVLLSSEDEYVGKDYLNSPIFKNSHYGNTINVILEDNEDFVLYISGPLRLDNTFLGIITIETNDDLLTKITQDQLSFDNLGEVIIATKNDNGDAQIITPLSKADYTKTIIPKGNLLDPITHSLMQHQTTFSDSVDYAGNDALSATRYIEETGWGLTVIFDKQAALAPLLQIQVTIILSGVAVVIVAIIASLIISNSISRPIKKLQLATKEIAQGKLAEKIKISGSDEIKDLSLDINKMQISLKQAQNNLIKNERFSAIGELSSRLAHDIRNPISIIKTAVSLWKQTHKDMSEKDLENLEMIDNATSKIKYLVENVLDFVRSREPKYEEVSLLKIIQFARKSIHASENIKISIPTNDIMIKCDPNQIEVVFENILTNSIQAIGDDSGSITVSTYKENDYVLILIQDSGGGIPEDIISKIFDPLFTTKREGTGLGLASCKSIIESHKGTLTVSNHPTTFRIKLPNI
jgi:signal transduction histidine kinase